MQCSTLCEKSLVFEILDASSLEREQKSMPVEQWQAVWLHNITVTLFPFLMGTNLNMTGPPMGIFYT